MLRALRCCLLLLLVCAALQCQGVLGQQATLPGIPLVEPTLAVLYANPAVFSAAPGGQSISPAIYCANYPSSQGEPRLYLAGSNGAVTLSTQAPFLISAIDPRPHGDLVWTLGFIANRSSAPQYDQFEYAVMSFDSSSLALKSVFPLTGALTPTPSLDLDQNSTSENPTGRVATDSAGRVFISAGPQVYVLDPSSGAQVGYFSLPNHDVISARNTSNPYETDGYAADFLNSEEGYAIAFDPQDNLWILDINTNADGSYTLMHTSSSGSVLSTGSVNLTLPGDTADSTFASLAVDSAGVAYISTGSRTVLKVALAGSAFTVSAALTYPSASPAVASANTELSISWGATPAQDAFYVQNIQAGDVYVLDNTGAMLSSFDPSHGYGTASSAAYDRYLDSIILTVDSGPHLAVRIARDASIIGFFDLPDEPQFAATLGSGLAPGFPAGDGAGNVAISYINYTDYAYNVLVYDRTGSVTAAFTAGTYTGLQIADGLIVVQSATNASILESYSLAGTLVSSAPVPMFSEASAWQLIDGVMYAVLYDASVVSIQLSTGVVTTVYSSPASLQLAIIAFAVSPAVGLLYLETLLIGDDGFAPLPLAVSLSTGAIIAELDAQQAVAQALFVAIASALAADPSGTLFIPDGSAGLRVFAPLTLPSVKGDPQFVGLRGQSFQVHGLDGEVYAIVSSASTQVNARFVFLSSGRCPVIDGVPASACWSHPGSYLGSISVQQIVDGRLHRLLLTSGAADAGFLSVELDDEPLRVGRSFSADPLSVEYESAYRCVVQTEEFRFVFDNSDGFINQAVWPRKPLQQLTAHGLFGQTHSLNRHATPLKFIEGDVDDYVVQDGDIFGHQFRFTQFDSKAAHSK